MKLLNTTGFPAAKHLGYLSEEEVLVTLALKVTCVLEGATLCPVAPELAWPVFESPMEMNGVLFPSELQYGWEAVDVHVLGNAHAPRGQLVRRMQVEVTSGQLSYKIDVIGDRRWQRGPKGDLLPTEPESFSMMPLTHERAFGGKALLDELEVPYGLNGQGRGFFGDEEAAEGGPLPNLERPGHHVSRWNDLPVPACLTVPLGSTLGFEKRFQLDADGVPATPTPWFFQGAVPDLIAERHQLGTTLRLTGFAPDRPLVYPLPGERESPRVQVTVGSRQSVFPMQLSTLVVLTEGRGLVLTFQRSFRYLFDASDTVRQAEILWEPAWLCGMPGASAGESARAQPGTALPVPTKPEPLVAPPPPATGPTPSPRHVFVAQPDPNGPPHLFLAVRRTYTLNDDGRATVADEQLPLPEQYAYYEDVAPEVVASCQMVPEGVAKNATDLIVKGFAHTYDRSVRILEAGIRLGGHRHSAHVFGKRVCEVLGGRIQFTEPEPFARIALRYENAYGGRDRAAEAAFLAAIPAESRKRAQPFLPDNVERFSPFLYARNPSGKGFVVGHDLKALEGRELPNLEDPEDLLTPQRLVCPDFTQWVRQPLPLGFDFLDLLAFPRIAMLGCCPLYSPAEVTFPEVERGLVARDFHRPHVLNLPPSRFPEALHPDVTRSASLGLSLPFLHGAVQIELQNIHPRRPCYVFQLPAEQPRLSVRCRGKEYAPEPRLYTVLVEPEEKRLSVVWCGAVPLARLLHPRELEQTESRIDWQVLHRR
jgi:hypothetical protein